MCDDLDLLKEMVEGDDSVKEHEEGFWHLEDVLQRASGLWLKVFDAVVGDIADGTSR